MPPKAVPRWDAAAFAQKVSQAKRSQNWDALKAALKEVAEHNYLMRDWWPIPRSVYVRHQDCLRHTARAVSGEPYISLSTMTTADAMLYFARKKARTCALNFANGVDIGGGYKNGSTAQEEDLCRQIPVLFTTLRNASKDGAYPFGPSTYVNPQNIGKYADVLFTAGLTVARDSLESGYAVLPEQDQARVAMVSAAAPNIRFANEVASPDLIYRTIQSVFLAPLMHDNKIDTLILGAFGCGAFGNDPKEIAELFVKALIQDNYGQLYKEVHFAIPKLSPKDNNYDVFSAVFSQYQLKVKNI